MIINFIFSGLIRASNAQTEHSNINNNNNNNNVNNNSVKHIGASNRQMSINSINSETIEEEKQHRDNSITEKNSIRASVAPTFCYLSNTTRASNLVNVSEWTRNKLKLKIISHFYLQRSNAGEEMAANDGISISSSESNKQTDIDNAIQSIDQDDDISTLTMNTDNKYSSLCK